MSKINFNKTISANSNGIIVSFRDVNKHKFIPYENSEISKIQLFGIVKYQKIEKKVFFNDIQKQLYQKVIHGFKAYSSEELTSMNKYNKLNIIISYSKTQRILKRWKQDIIFNSVDNFLKSMFPHSKTVKQIIEIKGYLNDEDNVDNITFAEIGIDRFQIANKLIEANLLPQNFYQLT